MNKQPKFFIVVQHVTRPRNRNKTHLAGYMKDPANYQVDELFNIVNKIKTKDLQTYHIILDLNNKKVVKNSYEKKTYEELMDYFVAHYQKEFTGMLAEYIKEVKTVGDATTEVPVNT